MIFSISTLVSVKLTTELLNTHAQAHSVMKLDYVASVNNLELLLVFMSYIKTQKPVEVL